MRFTYASWNVGNFSLGERQYPTFRKADAAAKGVAFRKLFDEVGADVFGLCEYSENFTCDSDLKAKDVAFPCYATMKIGAGQAGDWRRNAQMFKDFEVVSSISREFSWKRDPDVRWLETRVRRGTDEIVFVQTHLDWNTEGEEYRDVRVREMRELAAAYRHEPHVVISGDFNPGIRRKDAQGRSLPMIDNPSEFDVFVKAGYTLGNDGRFKTSRSGVSPDGRKGSALDNIIVRGFKLSEFKVWERYDLSDHALISCVLELEKCNAGSQDASCRPREGERPEYPVVMMRFSSAQTRSLVEWKETAKAFAENPGCCNDVWFSTGESFPSLDWHRRHMDCLKVAAADLRKLGIEVSLQFEATIGHGDDFPTKEEKAIFDKPWTGWTGPDGVECRYCNCPRQPGFLKRIAEVSELYAQIRPSVVWIDDDLRIVHHPPVSGQLGPGCWCDTCVAAFAAEEKRTWTRTELHAAWKKDGELKRRWENFSIRSMAEVACTIARHFRKLSPKTRMGLQTAVDRAELSRIVLRALADETGEKTCVRMGGGAYYDTPAYDMIVKSWNMTEGRRWMDLEDAVDNWCTEVEAYPRAYGSRSVRAMAIEAFTSMGWGFDTTSLFVMDRRSETDAFYSRYLLRPMVQVTKFLNDYRTACRGTQPAGFTCPIAAHDMRYLMGIPVLHGLGVSWGNISAEQESFPCIGAVWGDFRSDLMPDFRKTPSSKLQVVRDRLCGNAPMKLASPFIGVVLPRVAANGTIRTLGLIGTRLDPQEDVVLQFKAEVKRAAWHELGSDWRELAVEKGGGGFRVTVPSIGAWSIGFVTLDYGHENVR